MKDIPTYDTFAKIEPITKGISGDQKYYIETVDGKHLFSKRHNFHSVGKIFFSG